MQARFSARDERGRRPPHPRTDKEARIETPSRSQDKTERQDITYRRSLKEAVACLLRKHPVSSFFSRMRVACSTLICIATVGNVS